jgi:hypothetical protein
MKLASFGCSPSCRSVRSLARSDVGRTIVVSCRAQNESVSGRRRFQSRPRRQQFGIPAGREDALLPDPEPEPEAEPVPVPELPEPAMPDDAEPVVLPDEDPLAWLLSRAVLVLTSQH